MTEPDEALLWAREDFARPLRPYKDYIADKILSGAWDDDPSIRLSANAYRAGAAASEARIKALEEAIRDANKRLKDYSDPPPHPVYEWRKNKGTRPVRADVVVEVRFQCGETYQNTPAGGLDWRIFDGLYSIKEWRLPVEPDQ